MALSLVQPHAVASRLNDDPHDVMQAMCPMCHTRASVTQSAVDAGGDWRCVRCGQRWDAVRLAAVADYATWVVEHDRVDRLGTHGTDDVARHADPRDGTP